MKEYTYTCENEGCDNVIVSTAELSNKPVLCSECTKIYTMKKAALEQFNFRVGV